MRTRSRPDTGVAVVAWVGTRPDAARARLLERVVQIQIMGAPARLSAAEIDPDGDGQPDFVVHAWQGDGGGGRLVHASVAGRWKPLHQMSYAGCHD